MAEKTVYAPGGPAVVFGAKNLAYTGPQSANGGAVNGDAKTAVSDFHQEEDEQELETIENAGYHTKLVDIDFSEYTQDYPYEEEGSSMGQGPSMTRIFVDGTVLTYEEDWEDNPQSSISECLGIEYEDKETVEKLYPDEAYNIYDEEMSRYLSTDRVSAEVDPLEKDYQRWSISTSQDVEEDPDATMGGVWDDMATAANTFSYRIPESVRSTVSDRILKETDFGIRMGVVRGLKEAGYEDDFDEDVIEDISTDMKDLGFDDEESTERFLSNYITGGHSDTDQIDSNIEDYINENYGSVQNLNIPIDENSDKGVGTQIREYYYNKPEISVSDPFEISEANDRFYVTRVS